MSVESWGLKPFSATQVIVVGVLVQVQIPKRKSRPKYDTDLPPFSLCYIIQVSLLRESQVHIVFFMKSEHTVLIVRCGNRHR